MNESSCSRFSKKSWKGNTIGMINQIDWCIAEQVPYWEYSAISVWKTSKTWPIWILPVEPQRINTGTALNTLKTIWPIIKGNNPNITPRYYKGPGRYRFDWVRGKWGRGQAGNNGRKLGVKEGDGRIKHMISWDDIAMLMAVMQRQ